MITQSHGAKTGPGEPHAQPPSQGLRESTPGLQCQYGFKCPRDGRGGKLTSRVSLETRGLKTVTASETGADRDARFRIAEDPRHLIHYTFEPEQAADPDRRDTHSRA